MTPRRFLITGGSQGIGAALVRQARKGGHQVVFTGRNDARIEQVATETGAHGVDADVARAEDNARTVSECQSLMGGIDVLVNNAGYAYRGQIGAMDVCGRGRIFGESRRQGPIRPVPLTPGTRSSRLSSFGRLSMRCVMMAFFLSTALVLSLAGDARAQAPAANPVSKVVTDAWNGAKRNIRDSAIQMPEDGYAFKPVDTVRTFGQMIAHITGANYVYCSAARGEKSPYGEDHFEKALKSKADIVKALEESLAYCDQAYAAATDARLAEMIDQPFGGGKVARAEALVGNTGHLQEHYGNLVTYFRIKGMVPPSSQPRR